MASKKQEAVATMESALPLLLVVLLSAQLAFCGQLVEYLPGYPGKLPFKLETGYIQVGASEIFYYFIESQGNPRTDPLFIWFSGGPGCTSLSAILYEMGPIEFDIDSYVGGIPPLKDYPYAWTKTASIIFIDSPVGTGFSYSITQEGWVSSDTKAAKDAYEFFLKWLDENRQYLGLQIFVGGDSYAGIIVPLVTKHIVEGNEAGVIPFVNLKAAKTSCNENYVDVDPTNTACVLALEQYRKCVENVWLNDILEPNCVFSSTRPHETWRSTRSLEEDGNFILSPPKIPSLWCRAFNYALADVWANDGTVRDALHIRKGTIKLWKRCNLTISYTKDQQSVVYAHRFLSNKSLLVLVLSGDRDMVVPFVGTIEWIKSLNLTIDIEWHPWFVDGQVAGSDAALLGLIFFISSVVVQHHSSCS
ncbi:hypothetical protein Nepgr_015423 [Nepenthes gracilis]|uniref:Serine carboxypeptidase-like 18 n=1 Tax=Nepenthes gracilis TaxID=150966 RepID=A0AAD3SM23_NEPGR|nr:hypothetical protein Nepgr_015423 [Nepenthes gracilis]